MGRRWIVVAAVATVCAGLVLAPATGAAGGGAVFDFDSEYYVPGDQVIAETSVGFGHGDRADLDEGPFFAWLYRSGTDFDRGTAVLLGPIDFERRGHDVAVARISFSVPDVRPGGYEIATCNEDCSGRWIGDLVGGWFIVVATREEIPLRELEDRLTDRIRSLRGRVDLLRDRLVDAETQANNAASDAQLVVDSSRDLDSKIRSLRAELARLRGDSSSSLLPEMAGSLAAGVLAGLGMTLLIARLRRRPELPVTPIETDSVPGDHLWRPDVEPGDQPELVGSGRR